MRCCQLITVIFIVLIAGCTKPQYLSLIKNDQVIALQPLGDFNTDEAQVIGNSLSAFFNKKVIILEPSQIPVEFLNKNIEEYSADSIINYLSYCKPDSIIEVVGLTHHRLYTMKYSNTIHKEFYDRGIFGLGSQPGNSCIISDRKFGTNNDPVYMTRTFNSIIHEVGHNMGLSHCNNKDCIMSEGYGYIFKLSELKADYCARCRRRLTSR